MMLLYVIDTNLDIIGIIENTISVIWTNRYFEPGDFEVYAPATDEYIALLQRNNILVRDGEWTNGMIIENLQITTDEERGNTITVTGRCLKSIVSRRIVWQQTNIKGNVETGIKKLLDDNLISPQDPARQISNMVYQRNGNIAAEMSNQFTGDNLCDVISQLCQKNGIGFDVLLDLENKWFIFLLYVGTDRSYDQNQNPYVVFSNDFENLLTSTYIENASAYKNVAKVAGEGEGIARKSATVGTASGMDRYELFVDNRGSSTNNGEISDADYMQMLEDAGSDKLTEHVILQSYDGEVETGTNYVYGTDFYLGDIVEIVNEYGMEASSRVIEIIQSEDASGMHTIPTFSTWF